MYDTRTVVGSHIVAEDNTESLALHLHKLVTTILRSKYFLRMSGCIVCDKLRSEQIHLLAWFHPWHELLVVHTLEFCTLHVVDDTPWALLLLLVERKKVALLALLVSLQVRAYQSLRHDKRHRLTIVEIVGLDGYIVNLRTHAESHVRWQSPRSSCPCDEVRFAPLRPLCLRILDKELYSGGEVLYVAIATRLVQLVRAKTCTRTWRIWLDGITLVEQALVVELLQKPPQSLDVLIVVSDIRMVKVNEVAHLLSQFTPLGSELHHVLTALMVVVFRRDVLLRSLVVNILLGNTQFLLDTQLHRKSVGIPSRLAVNLESLHSLVSVECILNTTCEDVVNTRVSVCRWRPLKEDKLRAAFTLINRLVEDVVLLPLC